MRHFYAFLTPPLNGNPQRATLPLLINVGSMPRSDAANPSALAQWHMHSATGHTDLDANHSARCDAWL